MLKVYSSKYYTAVKLGYSQETDLERQKIYHNPSIICHYVIVVIFPKFGN